MRSLRNLLTQLGQGMILAPVVNSRKLLERTSSGTEKAIPLLLYTNVKDRMCLSCSLNKCSESAISSLRLETGNGYAWSTGQQVNVYTIFWFKSNCRFRIFIQPSDRKL